MTRKPMFSKILFLNILSMLVCVIFMGSALMIMLTNYFTEQTKRDLDKNAEAIVNMIQKGITLGDLNNVVNGFSRVTGCHIFVIESPGKVISCSANNNLISDPPDYISDKVIRDVLAGNENSSIGTLGGIFNEPAFTLQLPITGRNDKVLGAVLISRPIPEQIRIRYELFEIIFISMLLIVVASILFSYLLARRFSIPMKQMRDTTKEFAKGNLSARAPASAEKSNISEIAELAESFNAMATELEKSEEIKNAFISDISHELRTPMTTISGFVSGILDDTIPQEKQREYLKIVYSEISRLSRLVNTFLDITRLQSDKMILNMTSFDINELIRVVIIGLEQKIEERHINIELILESEKCYTYADRDSITRVITNLLDNAVKFTNENGLITITVAVQKNDVYIAIKNTGKGIPEDQQYMIFNRFYKTDKSRSENKEGTGIGLYLVKNILHAHGKDIFVRSVQNEYAEFSFSLPKGKPPATRTKKIND